MQNSNIRPVDGAKWNTCGKRRAALTVGAYRCSTAATLAFVFAQSMGFGKKWG
jgi:hypothetical protein